MYTKKWTWLISAALVIMLLTLTGCQSVEGLNLAKAIQNDWSVKSSESKSTLQLDFVSGDTSKLSAEEKAALAALQNVKVELAVKTQDSQHLSADGSIIYSKGKIPFKVGTEGTKIALSIEGAKKPIVIDLLGSANISFLKLLPKALQEQFGNKLLEIKPALIGLILGNTPDLAHLTVTPVTDQVNGESLSLQKAHVELNGSELAALLPKLLANVVADEAGLKDVLSQLYDALLPVIQEQISAGDTSLTLQVLTNKDIALSLVTSPIQDYIKKLADSFTTTLTGGGSSEGGMKDLFSTNSSLQADFYTDANKQVRKQSLSVNLPLSNSTTGVSAVKLTLTSESWNLNKPITANTIDTTGALQLGLDATSTFKLLANQDKQSTFYSMLKNDLRVTKKDINMKTDGSGGSEDAPEPFIKANGPIGVTMVPVRFVSEQLGAEVGWNGDLRQVTITDFITGKTLLLTLDSSNANVNGTSTELEMAATLLNNTTFVPIRIIAETFDCKVSFNNDTRVVTIHRD